MKNSDSHPSLCSPRFEWKGKTAMLPVAAWAEAKEGETI